MESLKERIHTLVSERVVEKRQKTGAREGPIQVVFKWHEVEVVLAETPSGSLSARRDMIITALTELCGEAVNLHDCCEQVVDAVSDS